MVQKNITKENVLSAISEIDKNGIPSNRNSTKFYLGYNDKLYPPKYVISLAFKFANGRELEPNEFSGGNETNSILSKLGFTIQEGHNPLTSGSEPVFIATAIIESDEEYDNDSRFKLLNDILNTIDEVDVVVLPAGFLKYSKFSDIDIKAIEQTVANLIKNSGKNLAVCFGIDAAKGKHQLGIAATANRILAIGRKFFPTSYEKESIIIASSANELEFGFERTFNWKGKRFFIAICYDSFGIKHLKLPQQNIDYIIDLIHGFYPKGEGESGEVYFAKHGIAGAAKQWECPAFGSAVFFYRKLPVNWQSGIIWNKGSLSTQLWKYEDNPLRYFKLIEVNSGSEKAIVRLFKYPDEIT